MAKQSITEGEMIAALLKHKKGSGGWHAIGGMTNSPMRRALIKAGYLAKHGRAGNCYIITDAGREKLVDVPGSGIRRSAPLG